MRISDWSSDVCSSDLCTLAPGSLHVGVQAKRGFACSSAARLTHGWMQHRRTAGAWLATGSWCTPCPQWPRHAEYGGPIDRTEVAAVERGRTPVPQTEQFALGKTAAWRPPTHRPTT